LRLHLPIKGCNLCISPSLPARAADCSKVALGFYLITIGNNEGTGPSIIIQICHSFVWGCCTIPQATSPMPRGLSLFARVNGWKYAS